MWLRLGRGALVVAFGNLVVVAGFTVAGTVSPWLLVPFGIQAAETLWGTLHPATGVRPKVIGIRQLVVTVLFTVAFMLTWGR